MNKSVAWYVDGTCEFNIEGNKYQCTIQQFEEVMLPYKKPLLAELTTNCGCTKRIEITSMVPYLRMPLYNKDIARALTATEVVMFGDSSSFPSRTFVYIETTPMGILIYHEKN